MRLHLVNSYNNCTFAYCNHKLRMKTIFKKFDKRTISTLPRATFPGEIKVIENQEDAEAAVDFLLSQDILGVDTETRPSFKKGVSFIVALLQVSTLDVCYLFRLNKLGLSPAIIRFLTDKVVPKIGLSWHDDLHQLHKRGEFEPGLFIDIQDISSDFGIQDLSLQKLYANLFHQKISKSQRLSNWEADHLRASQMLYAATDAWACINLYNELNRLIETRDYEFVEPEVEEPVADADADHEEAADYASSDEDSQQVASL